MKFRKMTGRDIAKIASWNIELHEDEGSTPMAPADAELRLRRWLSTGRFEGALLIVEGQEVGYLLYEYQPADSELRVSTNAIYIRQFYITRDRRRAGLGSAAIRAFLAEQADDFNITLDVKTTNPGAQKFWESLGFVAMHTAYQLK